uniref:Uncharacterized protein n=1 Tax=Candidatus Kentrum sp. SD TaxID=2126332 RepID=A0A450YS59_9GAMM|nr:MAG: hypothetical protein BECKSD772F_GA0070984_11774 [Candidatus Kentron sp. SD]
MSIDSLDASFQNECINDLYEGNFRVSRALINLEKADKINDVAQIISFGSLCSYDYRNDHPIEAKKFDRAESEIYHLESICERIREAIEVAILSIKNGYSTLKTLDNEIKELKEDSFLALESSRTWLELDANSKNRKIAY